MIRTQIVTAIQRSSVEADKSPMPWPVGKVAVLYDEKHEARGFYLAERPAKRRSEIPAEMFSHQIQDLDRDDPEALAAFMSEYGMIFDSGPLALYEMEQYCRTVAPLDDETLIAIKPSSMDKNGSFANYYWTMGRDLTHDLWRQEAQRLKSFGITMETEELSLPMKERAASIEERRMALDRAKDKSPQNITRPLLVSIAEVQECLKRIDDLAKLAKAFHFQDDLGQFCEYLGVPAEEVLGEICRRDDILNDLIACIHPRVGICLEDANSATIEPIKFEDTMEAHYADFSLMNAIGLQLWNFNKESDLIRECAECHDFFITKQAKNKTARANKTSAYCCDKCKNKSSQRKHRMSEGYRNKQDAKRNSAV